MKAIFTDIDGVLNCSSTKERVYNSKIIGVEDVFIERLKKIVDATGAKIILTSSWKLFWEEDNDNNQIKYLRERLKEYGLELYDRTFDRGNNRGYGILKYVGHNDVSRWAVLDDDVFDDYKVFGILNHFVETDWKRGLSDEDVEKAIGYING